MLRSVMEKQPEISIDCGKNDGFLVVAYSNEIVRAVLQNPENKVLLIQEVKGVERAR